MAKAIDEYMRLREKAGNLNRQKRRWPKASKVYWLLDEQLQAVRAEQKPWEQQAVKNGDMGYIGMFSLPAK